jgi:hypothetical protein
MSCHNRFSSLYSSSESEVCVDAVIFGFIQPWCPGSRCALSHSSSDSNRLQPSSFQAARLLQGVFKTSLLGIFEDFIVLMKDFTFGCLKDINDGSRGDVGIDIARSIPRDKRQFHLLAFGIHNHFSREDFIAKRADQNQSILFFARKGSQLARPRQRPSSRRRWLKDVEVILSPGTRDNLRTIACARRTGFTQINFESVRK